MNTPASRFLLHCITRLSVFFTALGLLATTARPALVVNTDLGPIGPGSVNLTGTTVGGPNNANRYSNATAGLYWGSEYVYQFTTTVRSAISISSDDPNGPPVDNDFFLLNTTATTPDGALNVATGLGNVLVQINGNFGLFDPGTYYLVVDAYAFSNSAAPGNAGPFNATLTVTPVAPALPTPGGSITTTLIAGQVLWFSFNHAGGAFTVDTIGSALSPDNDTELFLFNSAGVQAAANDDISGVDFLSRISNANLAAGDYFLAVGGYNTASATGPTVTNDSPEAGDLVINGLSVPAPAADPHLAAVSLVGTTQTLRLTGTVGKTYLIEKSAIITPPSWVQDGAPVTLTTAEQTITRTVGAGETRQFHRAREQ